MHSLEWVVLRNISATRTCILIILLTRLVILITSLSAVKPSSVFLWCHWIIYLVLVIIFLLKRRLAYFVLSEVSLIPISLIIFGWGYQPERSAAFMYLFLYTVCAALPLLVTLLRLGSLGFIWHLSEPVSLGSQGGAIGLTGGALRLTTVRAFLVKFPVYGVHLWLPKAHVEAPVTGSIILAGLLLKLGGFGWFLLLPLINDLGVNLVLASWAGAGAVRVSFTCLRQVDLKVLIAYSSVAHLGVVIMALRISTTFAFMGGIFIMVAHGISSPGMFYGANCFYLRSGSRNVLLNSRTAQFTATLGIWWFIFCMANMRAPPSGNLLAELIVIRGLVNTHWALTVQLGLLIFLSGAYTLIVYSASQQRQKKPKFWTRGPLSYLETLIFFLLALCVYSLTAAVVVL